MFGSRFDKISDKDSIYKGRYLKHKWQIKILKKIFCHLNGPITKIIRREAVQKTGLKWNQIYKWIFDSGDKIPLNRIRKDNFMSQNRIETFRNSKIFEIKKMSRFYHDQSNNKI